MQGLSLDMPTGYYLERDPDILALRRPDGSLVGAFSARGSAPDDVRRMVRETVREERSVAVQHSLQARFFGHFELLCDGENMPLGRNGKALTILKYLLANRTRPVSQDHLMAWLWPDSNLKRARWSLNSAIYALRKLLRGQLSPVASSDFILFDKSYYQLDPSVEVWTDKDEFEARCEHGRHLERTQRKPEAVAEYEAAVGLYRGDYLVEDLYEDWTMVERERFADGYMDMLSRLASYYMET